MHPCGLRRRLHRQELGIQFAALQAVRRQAGQVCGELRLPDCQGTHGYDPRDGDRFDSPLAQYTNSACGAQRVAGSKDPGIHSPRKPRILEQGCGFALQQTVSDFDDDIVGFLRRRICDQKVMQGYKFMRGTKIGRWKSAIYEVESYTSPGIQQVPSILAGGCTREFNGCNPETLMAETHDQAQRGVRLAGIHRGSADNNSVGLTCGEPWGNSEVTQAKNVAVGISEEPDQAQLTWVSGFGMLALHQPAHSPHREQIAAVGIAARIGLKLHGRVTVPEDNGDQVFLVQGATAAIGKFQARVPSDFLYPCQRNVSRLWKIGVRQ